MYGRGVRHRQQCYCTTTVDFCFVLFSSHVTLFVRFCLCLFCDASVSKKSDDSFSLSLSLNSLSINRFWLADIARCAFFSEASSLVSVSAAAAPVQKCQCLTIALDAGNDSLLRSDLSCEENEGDQRHTHTADTDLSSR